MRKGFLSLTWIGFIWYIGLVSAVAQQLSANQVNYQLTYDANTQVYTVWVVPNYATPNADGNEFGATAQVSLKVSKILKFRTLPTSKVLGRKIP